MALLTRPSGGVRGTTAALATVLLLAACSEELQVDEVNRCDNRIEYYSWSTWQERSVQFDIDSPPTDARIDAKATRRSVGLARAERIDLYDLDGEVVITVDVPDGADQIEIVIDGEACARLAAR